MKQEVVPRAQQWVLTENSLFLIFGYDWKGKVLKRGKSCDFWNGKEPRNGYWTKTLCLVLFAVMVKKELKRGMSL